MRVTGLPSSADNTCSAAILPIDPLPEHEGEDRITAADALKLAQRQQSRRQRRGGMNDRRHMGIAEIEHIGARGIEKRRVQRVDPRAPADNRRLSSAGKGRERLQRGFDCRLAAARQSDRKEVHQQALGLMDDGRLQCVPSRIDHESREPFGDLGIPLHNHPRKKGREHPPPRAKVQG